MRGISHVITRLYAFEAAHFLPNVREGHKCKRMHGHNYEIEVTCSGPIDGVGFIVDFWDLDKVVDPLVARVDHRVLNEIVGLENPTAEYIAQWFLVGLEQALVTVAGNWRVDSVRVFETKNCSAIASR